VSWLSTARTDSQPPQRIRAMRCRCRDNSTIEFLQNWLRTTTFVIGRELHALDSRLTMICLTARGRITEMVLRYPCPASALVFGASDTTRSDSASVFDRSAARCRASCGGFDLRHVEDVVDDLEQILPLVQDVVAIFLILVRTERSEHAAAIDLGKPMMG